MRDIAEVWLVAFDYDRPPGERPRPTGLSLRRYGDNKTIWLEQEQLAAADPPFPLDAKSLYVTYDAPAALGCHLALGWKLPAKVLDLHAEFRCLTSGLIEPGEYTLGDALSYFGLSGDGTAGLDSLLTALSPRIDWPRAVAIRGHYTLAVARMEETGVPIDVERFYRLRNGWESLRDKLIERVDSDFGVYRDGRLSSDIFFSRSATIRFPDHPEYPVSL
jgi:DNA polymerase I